MSSTATPSPEPADSQLACVLSFNANDPSGAGGLAADMLAAASTGVHLLPVVTGTYVRDTAEIFDHIALEEEAVAEQARVLLEDMEVAFFKVGFVGSPENLSTIAEITTDYPDIPVVAWMPDLSWWSEVQIDLYQDAFRELLLPQTTLLIGNHGTLWRWLLPDWQAERPPSARDLARAVAELGVSYVLVTGISAPDQFIDNVLATPQTVLSSQKLERFDAAFCGAGDTLSATVTSLLAGGCELNEAFADAMSYLDQALDNGYRPGMGHVIPDRLFWAQAGSEPDAETSEDGLAPSDNSFQLPPHDTQH